MDIMECQYQTGLSTSCMLCLRPTLKWPDENKCWQKKIEDLYVIYLKPKLVKTTVPINWVRGVEKSSLSYCHYCSDCIKAGQKLTSLNDRLIDLQCEIQAFVQNLSGEILKYREELTLGQYRSVDFLSPNRQHFTDYLASGIEIKKEDENIKEEVEIASIYTDEEEYISNQASCLKSQNYFNDSVDSLDPLDDHVDSKDHLDDHVDSRDPFEDHFNSHDPLEDYVDSQDILEDLVDSNDSTDRDNGFIHSWTTEQDSSDIIRKTSASKVQKGSTLSLDRKTANSKDITALLKNIQSRKLVISLQRLEDSCNRKPVAAKRRKLGKNENDKLLYTRHTDETNSTKLSRTRGKKQSFKHLLDQYEVDFDIDGNEIKSIPYDSSDSKNDDSDFELDDEIDEQVETLSANITDSLNQETTQRLLECTECSKKFRNLESFEGHMFKKHKRTIAPCTKCDKIFMDRETRTSHIKSVHKSGQSFCCPICPDLENFANLYEFEIHTMTHTEEIPYVCPRCHENFSNARNYCEHQKSSVCANSNGQFSCTNCNEVFKAKCLLITHVAVFHKGNIRKSSRLFQCEICENFATEKFYLEDHYAEEHTEEFIIPCDICGMSLQNLEKFDEHRKSHRMFVGIQCTLCDKTFPTPYHLKCHMQNMHQEDISERICKHCGKKFVGCKRKYKYHSQRCNKACFCDICGKKFLVAYLLKEHIKLHKDGFPICTICNREYTSNSALRAHISTSHLKKYSVMCELCGKSLYSKNALKSHMRSKHSEKTENPSIECKLCGEKFNNEYKLSTHHDLVHKVESYSCQYCSEEFPTKGALKSHEDTKHYEVRNKDFKCTACPAVFKQKRQRAKHRKLMHPELVICNVNKQCQICNKVFHSASALKNHMRRHERDKNGSFQCELCIRTFLKQQSLTWHMNQDHNMKRSKR